MNIISESTAGKIIDSLNEFVQSQDALNEYGLPMEKIDEMVSIIQNVINENEKNLLKEMMRESEIEWKVGSKVKIMDNINEHGFEIGELVEIIRIRKWDYECKSLTFSDIKWFIQKNEAVLISIGNDF